MTTIDKDYAIREIKELKEKISLAEEIFQQKEFQSMLDLEEILIKNKSYQKYLYFTYGEMLESMLIKPFHSGCADSPSKIKYMYEHNKDLLSQLEVLLAKESNNDNN